MKRPNGVDVLIVVALLEEFSSVKTVLTIGNLPQQAGSATYYLFTVGRKGGAPIQGAIGCISDMGIEEADAFTTSLLPIVRPRLVVSLGISGTIDDNVRLGDVVVSTDIDNYAYRSKVEQRDPSTTLTVEDLKFGGKSLPATEFLYKSAIELEHQFADEWEEWRQRAAAFGNRRLRSTDLQRLKDKGLVGDAQTAHAGPTACGPSVVASRDFKLVLKSKNRNFLSVDMESYGVLRAVQRSQSGAYTCAIRGVSDPSDERKKELDGIESGSIRAWAITNATTLLLSILRTSPALVSKRRGAVTNMQARDLSERAEQLHHLCVSEFLPRYYQNPRKLTLQGTDSTALFDSTDRDDQNETNFLVDILKRINNSTPDIALQLEGRAGTGKSTLLALLYWQVHEEWLSNNTQLLPVYINLHWSATLFRKGWERVAKDKLENLLESHFRQLREFTESYPDQQVLFLLDGLDEHIPFKELTFQSLRDLIESSTHRKIVATREDRDSLLGNTRTSPGVMLHPVPVGARRYERFIPAFLKLIGRQESGLATEIQAKVDALQLREVDFFTIALLINYSSGRGRGGTKLSRYVESYCKDYLKRQGVNLELDNLLDIAAEAAFHKTFSARPPIPEHSWTMMELIEKHSLVRDYFVARHVSKKLLGIKDAPIVEINNLSFAYPFRINRFSKEMLTDSDQTQTATVAVIQKIIRSPEANDNAKAHACYLAGRVTASQSREKAKDLLRSLLDGQEDSRARTQKESKSGLLLDRSVHISLAYLGEYRAEKEYIETLLTEPQADRFNRGFHLEYYDDLPYDPGEPLSSDDNLEACPKTFDQLFWRAQKGDSNPIFHIELQTLCSLAQHRHAAGRLPNDIKTKLISLLEQLLRESRIKNVLLKPYAAMVLKHLSDSSFRPIELFDTLYGIKALPRAGWLRRNLVDCESVSDHTYGAYLLGLFFLPERFDVKEYDKPRILEMLLIHDLAEAVVGDFPPSERSEEIERWERETFQEIGLLGTYTEFAQLHKVFQLWDEFDKGSTINASVARDIDKIDNAAQIMKYRKEGVEIPASEDWLSQLRSEISTDLGGAIYDKVVAIYANPGE